MEKTLYLSIDRYSVHRRSNSQYFLKHISNTNKRITIFICRFLKIRNQFTFPIYLKKKKNNENNYFILVPLQKNSDEDYIDKYITFVGIQYLKSEKIQKCSLEKSNNLQIQTCKIQR